MKSRNLITGSVAVLVTGFLLLAIPVTNAEMSDSKQGSVHITVLIPQVEQQPSPAQAPPADPQPVAPPIDDPPAATPPSEEGEADTGASDDAPVTTSDSSDSPEQKEVHEDPEVPEG